MKILRLSEVCDLRNGFAFKSSDYVEKSNTLNIRMSNIRPSGLFDLDYSPKYLPDNFYLKYIDFALKDGDIIIAMTDMANDPKILGVPTIVYTNGKNLLLNQRVGKLVLKDRSLVNINYLQYALNRDVIKDYYKNFAGGGLQLNLGKKELLSVQIPLPSLSTQQQIARILDQADALRN
mgnify:CR=1 FL=1